ncbi:tail fiber domain-containing protein [Escherichia coli]|nr:tail fiber domain-containing protein [Escherichia coli]
MTRLPESSTWEEEIELISRSERVSGGLDGVANRPLIALANRTRHLKDKADESDELVAEKVSAIKTFAEGATLGSPREEILYGTYRLVWTGDFPKTVEAGSTPQETGGIGAGTWAYTSDAAIRQDLSSEKKGDGASIVALEQGGTLQNAITWLTPEAFGGGVGVEDNGPALRAIAEQAAANNTIPYVRFSGRTYQVKTKVVFDRAVIFEGAGALHGSLLADTIHESDKIQRCSTLIKDTRDFDTSDFLFEFKDGDRPVLGVAFRGVEFVGASVNDAPEKYKTCGVFINISGWVTSSSNLLVRDFGLTGLKVNHNDGAWNNTSVLRCGGKLGGTVYYALDMKREDGSGTFTNQHKFNNPHIEHCRYAIRCSGYMNLFHGGHLELNDDSFIPDGDSHPVVLFEQLTYPVTFDKMTFISPATLRYLDGYAPTTDPAQLAANLAALPAFFGGVAGSVIDPTSDTAKALIRFDGCDFTNSNKPVKWFDIPDVRTYISGCHITRASTWSSCIKLGQDSKILNSFIQSAVVTGDTSNYASLVNNVYSIPVAGYGHISADNVDFFGGNSSFACFSAAGGTGSVRTKLTNISLGGYGATIGTRLGDYINGYLSSFNGVMVQSNDGNYNVRIDYDRLTSSSGGITLGSSLYTASRLGTIANIDGNGNFWAPTANDRNWLGARAAANSWNGVFTKAFFMGAASPDGYWQAGLYPTAAAAYSIGTTSLPINNIYLQNSPIIISDATHKLGVQDVEALLISAVGTVKFQMWKMKKAVTEKSADAARWHVGVIAQQVRDALIAAGLDWTSYGLLTYEEVEVEVVRDSEGNLTPADPDQNMIEVDANGFVSIQSEQDTVTEKNGALYFTTGVYMLRMEEFLALRMAYIESQLT